MFQSCFKIKQKLNMFNSCLKIKQELNLFKNEKN